MSNKKFLYQTILFILITFVISAFPLFVGYFLKIANPVEYGYIQGNKQDLEFTYKEILFYASIILCTFLISASLRYLRNRAILFAALLIPFSYLLLAFLFIMADTIYYILFSYRLTFSVVQTILNTDVQEIKDFIGIYASPGSVLTLVAAVGLIVLIIWKRFWFAGLLRSKPFFIISLCIAAFGIFDFEVLNFLQGNRFSNVRYWDITIGEYQEYRDFLDQMQRDKNTINLAKDYDEFFRKDSVPKTFVLVISESLSKNHMSLYGYSRGTTPNLDTNKALIKFKDCVSYAALTIDAVPSLFFNDFQSKDINLIALLNKVGYQTAWISNQAGWGRKDAPIVLLSQLSKKSIFNDSLAENDKSNASLHYDEEILSSFENVLNSDPGASKFIVLHFMGCHFDYERRFPSTRNYFTSTPPKKAVQTDKANQIINAYDNAVRYHDSVVNCVIKSFNKFSADKHAALLFLSDHGEDVFDSKDYLGHCYPPNKVMSEIPYFVIFSPPYMKNYPELVGTAKDRVNTPYSTGNNFYSILDLLQVDSRKYGDNLKKKSHFSKSYDSTYTRFVMGCDYSKMK